MEVMVIPLSSAVRTSMLFSSLFDVDSMIVPFFASMTLPCFSCGLSMRVVMPSTRGWECLGPRWVSWRQRISHWCSLQSLATSSSLVADSPSTFRDMMVKAGLGGGCWPLFLFRANGLLPFVELLDIIFGLASKCLVEFASNIDDITWQGLATWMLLPWSPPSCFYITCHLADAFIQSNLQLSRLIRRHAPWSNVGLRALLKGPIAVQILSWSHQDSNHRPCGCKSSSLTTTLHATMMDIATWALEYVGKSLSFNTICHCIKNCNLKLYYAKMKTFTHFAQKPQSYLGPKSSEMEKRQWKHVLWSDESAYFWGKRMLHSLCQRWKKNIQTVTNKKCKNQPLWWYGSASVATAWVICIYVKVPLMQKLRLEFWRDICCHQDDFSQELHANFSRTMPGLILHELQQRGFVGRECVCLTGLPALPALAWSVSYWKCMPHHEEENQTAVTTDCWAAHVLYTPGMGKNFTCKTATIEIFSSQTITKCY